MGFLDNYKDSALAKRILAKIRSYTQPVSLMEVCGTHTVNIFKTGIRAALPECINLVSGPGCPVCVTPAEVIEKAIVLSCQKDNILFCFGDMVRVPGISGSLETARADNGARVKVMYSPIEALEYARSNPQLNVILFGVGFETTIPLFASVIIRAARIGIHNLYLLPAFKLIPPAMEALLAVPDTNIDAFLLPGHVSTVIGEKAYQFLPEKFKATGVITGFEVVDILEGILMAVDMVKNSEVGIKNQYSRVVSLEGNTKAKDLISKVFIEAASKWRGLAIIDRSGLKLKEEYAGFDAEKFIDFEIEEAEGPKECICGEVIMGKKKPLDCNLFGKACTPHNPIGPCMVSSEGTCSAYYRYGV